MAWAQNTQSPAGREHACRGMFVRFFCVQEVGRGPALHLEAPSSFSIFWLLCPKKPSPALSTVPTTRAGGRRLRGVGRGFTRGR
jgi:hypothetical protein